jgi:hypothetical protein
MLKYVDSQEEFNTYAKEFKGHDNTGWIEYYLNMRKAIFLSRLYIYYWLFQFHFRLGHDFDCTLPGLEIKYACEEAEKLGAKLHFLGPEMDRPTWSRLYHETRMNVIHYAMKRV